MFGHKVPTILILLLSLMTIGSQLSEAKINFTYPVRSAAEDEVTSIPGLSYKPNFKHYSGYLEADDEQPRNRFWHYWFVESRSNPAVDPLVLWLNGGPGCSSMLGLLTELGPFSVNKDGELVDNPFAWNERANVIFMESPAGVGFSYAVNGDIKADDDTTAKQNHLALKSFIRKFPQYKNNPLYLTGESYGGVYLPTLAALVDDDKELNLKGVAVGNGYLDANKLAESLVYFSYYHGLLGRSQWERISQDCCDGRPPARGACKLASPTKPAKCAELVNELTDTILNSGLNPYNMYDRCAGSGQKQRLGLASGGQERAFVHSREHFDKSMILSFFNNATSGLKRSRYPKPTEFRLAQSVRGDPPCTDDKITIDYMNQKEVRSALHIPEDLTTPFTTCFDGIQYTMIYPGSKDGLAPQMRKLLASERKLSLLVYNGDIDMMCNFFGDEWFVDDLGREVVRDYESWRVNGQVAGFVKHFDGIVYMTVKGSGHMVPTDKPAEALVMFNNFLFGHNKHTEF